MKQFHIGFKHFSLTNCGRISILRIADLEIVRIGRMFAIGGAAA